MTEIMSRFQPEEMPSKIFFSTKTSERLEIGHARGAVVIGLRSEQVKIFEYSPLEIRDPWWVTGVHQRSRSVSMTQVIWK